MARFGGWFDCPSCNRTVWIFPWPHEYDAREALEQLNKEVAALERGTCGRQKFFDAAMDLAVPYLKAINETYEVLVRLEPHLFRRIVGRVERLDDAMQRWAQSINKAEFEDWVAGSSSTYGARFRAWLSAFRDGLKALVDLDETYQNPPSEHDDDGGSKVRIPRPTPPSLRFHHQWPRE